ncbi:hypothetical protein AB4Z22_18420 [Paenibacillus sp. TAF58]
MSDVVKVKVIDPGATIVLTKLEEAGYEAYLVGGCVRDAVLGRSIKDIDIATSALPEQVMSCFPRTAPTGLQAGVLRCVGNAEERFGEDALRMLRCVRFASTYGLEVELSTWQALLAQAPLLRHIAMERVRSELQRMIEGPAPARAVRLLLASRLTAYLKKQLPLPFERWLAWDEALDAVSALSGQHDRWAMLLMLLEMPADTVRTALQELTFSRADGEAVVAVLALREAVAAQLTSGAPQDAALEQDPAPLERVWKLGAVRRGEAAARALLRLLRVLPPSPEERGELARFLHTTAPELLLHGDTWLKEVPCFSLKELAITGTDLAEELGRQPGPWMGVLLQQLLERTALGEIPNERESLLLAARAAK